MKIRHCGTPHLILMATLVTVIATPLLAQESPSEPMVAADHPVTDQPAVAEIRPIDINDGPDIGFTGVRFGISGRSKLSLGLTASIDDISFSVRNLSNPATPPMLENSDLDLASGTGFGFGLRGTMGRFHAGVHGSLHSFSSTRRAATRALFVGDVQLGIGSALDPSLSVSSFGFEFGYALLSGTELMLGVGGRLDSLQASLDVAPGLSQEFSGVAMSLTAFGCWFLSPQFDLLFRGSAGDRFAAEASLMWAGLHEDWMIGVRAGWSSVTFSEGRTTPVNGFSIDGEFTVTSPTLGLVIEYIF